ncbi:MAG: hypothetical protein JNK05_06790 [Myxococcales bacterium]|nr:hypothetical protein [Myxococcales bacterium]
MNARLHFATAVLFVMTLAGCPSSLVGGQCAPGWVESDNQRCVRADASASDARVEPEDAQDAAQDAAQGDGSDARFDGNATDDGSTTDSSADSTASDGSAGDGGLSSDDADAATSTDAPPSDGGGCIEPLIACGGVCVDLNSDPDHCGGCGVRCPTGICNGGRCRAARAGHMVLIGSDYESSRPPQDVILANAVSLGSRGVIRLLTFARYANGAVRARVDSVVDSMIGAPRVRRSVLSNESELSRELTIDRFDALLVYDQRDATSSQMRSLALLWSDALAGFARAGGTVILLDGANPTHGSWLLARESGLLAVTDATDADTITIRLSPTAAADALASGVDVLFVASRNAVRYRLPTSDYVVFADDADATRPVVLHRAVLP